MDRFITNSVVLVHVYCTKSNNNKNGSYCCIGVDDTASPQQQITAAAYRAIPQIENVIGHRH